MAAQTFSYTKISDLTETSSLANADVFIVNHTQSGNTETCKVSFETLKTLIASQISGDISALTARVSTLETTASSLSATVADNSATISNIITAGFNLIGKE